MTKYERETCVNHLADGEVGNWVEASNGAYVERVNMVGGKFIMFDEFGELVGLTDSVTEALDYLEEMEGNYRHG